MRFIPFKMSNNRKWMSRKHTAGVSAYEDCILTLLSQLCGSFRRTNIPRNDAAAGRQTHMYVEKIS